MANAQHLNKQTTLGKALEAYKKEKKSVMSRTVDAIARTPEYFRFMSDLTAFHKQHGYAQIAHHQHYSIFLLTFICFQPIEQLFKPNPYLVVRS